MNTPTKITVLRLILTVFILLLLWDAFFSLIGVNFPKYDINGDGRCDSWDLVIVALLIDNGYTTPFVTGDVTGEGVVDVADVNATINIILEQKTASDYSGNADLTGDGVVDVADVNAIINIILTQDNQK